MRLEELDFDIPEELIAQEPLEPAGFLPPHASWCGRRLPAPGVLDLPDLLRPGDTLVFNDSRVLPARVRAHRATGGKVELLFLRPTGATGERTGERWEALARPSHRLRPGEELALPDGRDASCWRTRWERAAGWLRGRPGSLVWWLSWKRHGRLPLPPYIKTYPAEPSSYQTVYAATPGLGGRPDGRSAFHPRAADAPGASGSEVGVRDLARGAGHLPAHPRADRGGSPDPPGDVLGLRGGPADYPGGPRLGAATGGRGHHRHPGAWRRWPGLDGALDRTERRDGRESAERLDRHLHHSGLPFPGGGRASDQLPPAAQHRARADHGFRRRRAAAARRTRRPSP